jgi:adenosylcobinamide kinase/adenosylcobinamide-phosphate guanylyltransferase
MPKHSLAAPAPLIFVLGGARSGKSDYALALANRLAGEGTALFIATAQARDTEMEDRIARHREQRSPRWQTLEASQNIAAALETYTAQANSPGPAVLLVDCLTLLVSNILFAMQDVETASEAVVFARVQQELEALLQIHRSIACPLIIVSNEVGLGIVPVGRVSRLYRDVLGRANRYLTSAADYALFMLAGVPVDLKTLQRNLPPVLRT